MSQQQIVAAQQESVNLAWQQFYAHKALAEELSGQALTFEQIKAIADATLFPLAETVAIIRNARGELQIVAGLQAAFLRETTRALETERERFNIQRLQRIEPSQFGTLQQYAWQWQSYLQTLPGYDEQSQQFFVVLADNVARPIVTTTTALRYAIEDLTEIERRQLEGMWNLPAGATAYVPITSLFYQRQQAAGPPGGIPMAGPPPSIGQIDTTPVSTAVTDLSGDLMLAGDAAQAFAQLMFYAQNTLQVREQQLQMSVLTADRRRAIEATLARPWGEIYREVFGPTAADRGDTLHQQRYGAMPTITANINLQSRLILDGYVLAQAMERYGGKKLAVTARSYGTRGGGNAPRVMI